MAKKYDKEREYRVFADRPYRLALKWLIEKHGFSYKDECRSKDETIGIYYGLSPGQNLGYHPFPKNCQVSENPENYNIRFGKSGFVVA